AQRLQEVAARLVAENDAASPQLATVRGVRQRAGRGVRRAGCDGSCGSALSARGVQTGGGRRCRSNTLVNRADVPISGSERPGDIEVCSLPPRAVTICAAPSAPGDLLPIAYVLGATLERREARLPRIVRTAMIGGGAKRLCPQPGGRARGCFPLSGR